MLSNSKVSAVACQDADVKSEKLAIEDRMKLVATADWVTCPEGLLVTYKGRAFDIEVDSTQLPPGVHYAEVQATDVQHPARGILFRVPVTVCIPIEVRINLSLFV